MSLLKIRPLNDDDIKLIEIWLKKDYVKKWFTHPEDWLNEIKERNGKFKFIKHFIALYDDIPIGFCQYYSCIDAKEDWYKDTSMSGTYSVDYMIGEEDYLGKGLGKFMIGLLIKEIFSLIDSKIILVQPEEDNKASCKILLSNGFVFDEKNKFYFKTKNTNYD